LINQFLTIHTGQISAKDLTLNTLNKIFSHFAWLNRI